MEKVANAPQPLQEERSHHSRVGSSGSNSGADVLICSDHPLQAPPTAAGADGLARLSMMSCTSFGGATRSGAEPEAAAAAAAADAAVPAVGLQPAATPLFSTTSGHAAGAAANTDTTGSCPVPAEGMATQQPLVVTVGSSPDEAEDSHSSVPSGCSAAAMLAAASHEVLASKQMSWESGQFLADTPTAAAVGDHGDMFSQQEGVPAGGQGNFSAVLGEPSPADDAESADQLSAAGQDASNADSGHIGGAEEALEEDTELQPSLDGSAAAGQLDEDIMFASAQPGSAEEAEEGEGEGVSAYRISTFDEEGFSEAPARAAADEYELASSEDSERGSQADNVTADLSSPENSFSFIPEADQEMAPAGQADASPCTAATGEDKSSSGGNDADLHTSMAQASEPQSASPPEEGDLAGRASSALYAEVAAAESNRGCAPDAAAVS